MNTQTVETKEKKRATNPKDFKSKYTGIRRSIDWDKNSCDPVPVRSEASLLRSGVLVRRGEFGLIPNARETEIEQVANGFGITLAQALTMRQQLLVQKFSFSGSHAVQRKSHVIKNAIERKTPIMELTRQLNEPPMSIFRVFLLDRVRKAGKKPKKGQDDKMHKAKVREIVQGKSTELISKWEQEQLEIAKENDVIAYEPAIRKERADEWEAQLYNFLDDHDINYLSENDFREAGCPITPDCLILDELYINGKLVRWVEVKSYYLSGSKECSKLFNSKLKKQVKRYEEGFGEPGALLFKHGFSESATELLPTTLCLDSSMWIEAVNEKPK